MHRPVRLLVLAAAPIFIAACSAVPPPAPEPPREEPPVASKGTGEGMNMEYDLGGIDPSVAQKRFDALKDEWNDCFHRAHEKNETLSGKISFTIRTNKDGSVKWAFVTHTDLGDHVVEQCVIDSIKATNFGPPMDAKEGEIKEKSYGWEIDGDDDRPADPGATSSVLPALQKAKGKLDACREKAGAQGGMEATIYVAPKGKPRSVGVAISDPSAEGAIPCIVEVLSKLSYSNKSSWTTKVTVPLP
jgi:hypothetical protein